MKLNEKLEGCLTMEEIETLSMADLILAYGSNMYTQGVYEDLGAEDDEIKEEENLVVKELAKRLNVPVSDFNFDYKMR
jgi:hypothetical protein